MNKQSRGPSTGILVFFNVILVLATLFLVESAFQINYKIKEGSWRFLMKPDKTLRDRWFFTWHPYLVGIPKSGSWINGNIKINSHNMRGDEFDLKKKPGVVRIVAIGGSTTFGTRAADDETWPHYLQRELGDHAEVINYGTPGYSTVENLIQTAFHLSELNADVVLYFEGWNDMRVSYIEPLDPDYANFSGKQQLSSLSVVKDENNHRSATLFYLQKWLIGSAQDQLDADVDPKGSKDKLTDKTDERAIRLYKRNLKNLIALCRAQNVTPVFIPQIANRDALAGKDSTYDFMPFVKLKDIPKILDVYNEAMKKVALEAGVDYVEDVLKTRFDPTFFASGGDYVDYVHFNGKGNKTFAGILAGYLKSHNKLENSHVASK